MHYLFLFLSINVFAQTKASFFPRFPVEGVIEERLFDEEKIERNLEREKDTYRYVVNYQKLGKMKIEIAYPIHQLSQYSICSMSATQPLEVYNHFEPIYFETRFKCVTPPDYNPVKFRRELGDKYCSDTAIRSEAQLKICKELLFK